MSIPKISYNFSSIFLINKYLFIYIFLCFVIRVPYYVKPSIVLSIHIFDSTTSATSLIIQNNNLFTTANTTQGTSTVTGGGTVTGPPYTAASFPSFSTGGPSTSGPISSSIDKFMIFTTSNVNHTFTVPAGGLNCDILMIGGGGGSSGRAGGGAGACIVAINQTLTAGTCVVYVGEGGGSGYNSGSDSSITVAGSTQYRAKGGGAAGFSVAASGGCGGGAQWSSTGNTGAFPVETNVVNGSTTGPKRTISYAVLGNKGGDNTSPYDGGGGGGIGSAGYSCTAGSGLNSISIDGTSYHFKPYFANGEFFGHNDNGYIGGGGGGWDDNESSGQYDRPGGIGGGGGGGNYGSTAVPGATNTGSGGGGWNGSSGGSGIVIIRFRIGTSAPTYTHTPTTTTTLSTPTLGTPSIELVRGTQGDSNRDYKIGNYNGDFIVKSSVSGVDSDYISMLGTSGTIYNFTNSLYWNQTSDMRIKENIARASYDMCYDNIDKLELNRFNYIKEFNTGNKDTNQLGFIAQEIKDIFPKSVYTNSYSGGDLSIPDMLSIDIGQINYTLYGAVKKLMEINKDKEMRLKRLEGLLNVESDSGSEAVVDNMVIDSDVLIDSSNLLETSNIVIDTSNIAIDTSNIAIDTSNILIDTSNIAIDTSNIAIDTSNI